MSTTPSHQEDLDLLERTELSEPGDNERFSHYVRKDKIVASQVTGKAVIALCGKVWIPTRNPDRFPVCPACKEIFAQMKGGDSANR